MSERAITGHLELLYPSKYVKAADLRGKDVTVVIDHAEWENLIMQGGKRDRKVAIHLRSTTGKRLEKRWIVGKTVLRQIAKSTGKTDVAGWGGERVTLYPTTCRGADGSQVECIRVRVKVNERDAEVPEDMAAPVEAPAFVDELGDGEGETEGVEEDGGAA